MPDKIKILIVDDQIIIRKGIESALKTISFIGSIVHACNGKEAIELLEIKNFDVVLLDIKMPIMNGIDAAKIITTRFPNTKVIAISMFDDQKSVKSMFVNGAKGYLLKDTDQDEIATAIEMVMKGGNYFANAVNDVIIDIITNPNEVDDSKIELSEREIFVLKLICIKLNGLSYVDEAVIRFNEKASDKFDKNYDAYKLLSPDKERPSIATIANNQSFGINTMPLARSLKIPVKVIVSKAGTYSFNFEGLESFPSNYCVVLEDLFTHVKTDLMHTKTYSFEMSDTTNAPRFIMHLIAPLEVCASAANAGVGSDGTINIIGGNDGWLYELRNSKNELVSAGKANDESKLLSDLKADDYVLYLDNGMGNTNMSVPVSVGTKTTPVSFENNNTVFIEKGEAHVNLTDTTSFGDSYIWDFGDGSTLGTIQPNATHTYTKDGRYQVTITSNKGANKIVKNLVIDVFDAPSRKKAMDIQNINGEYYAVFKFEKTTQVTLQITNLDGQIVDAPMLIEGMVGCQKIDIPTLQKGNNIICLSDGKNKLTKKILQK